jgi:6-pyruvoyltetrahydropterin/6-carboxytetrahydropterin synthase
MLPFDNATGSLDFARNDSNGNSVIFSQMRARLTKDFSFEAAQTLPSAPEGHKCRRMHGHSFKIEVSVEGDVGGLENPTIENMAVWFWKKLAPQCPGLCQIVVHETPTARCVYRGQ